MPGKVTAYMAINKELDNMNLRVPKEFFYEELQEDLSDVASGALSLKGLRFVLRTLELKWIAQRRSEKA